VNLLAIDPGQTTGWAYFLNGELLQASYDTKEEVLIQTNRGTDILVIEKPAWYGTNNKVDVNDLIELAVFVGEMKQKYRMTTKEIVLVLPVAWKGTVPKKIHNQRVLDTLTEKERDLLPLRPRAKDYDHNMLDAVGLGLWKLGRL
jgi:hypothetical protein